MKNKAKLIISITFFVLAFLTFMIGVIYGVNMDVEKTEEIVNVDCFDKFNNKIIGAQCEDIIYHTESKSWIFLLIPMHLFPFIGMYFYSIYKRRLKNE